MCWIKLFYICSTQGLIVCIFPWAMFTNMNIMITYCASITCFIFISTQAYCFNQQWSCFVRHFLLWNQPKYYFLCNNTFFCSVFSIFSLFFSIICKGANSILFLLQSTLSIHYSIFYHCLELQCACNFLYFIFYELFKLSLSLI